MPVLPELEPLLERIRAGAEIEPAHLAEPVPAPPSVDHRVPVEDGEITVRLHRPDLDGPLGCHLFLAGGWWKGTLDGDDHACGQLVEGVGCAVARVGHRWAPEHPFPTPVEDCYAALTWLASNAPALGLDPRRISVGGVAAGANLAAATALMARDRGGPALLAQILEVPALDLTLSQASIEWLAEDYMLTRERLALAVEDYCPAGRRTDPYASPLLAPDLSGLPPALIAAAEYDLLRDDGTRYAERLDAAGVAATAVLWRGHLHGSLGMTRLLPSAAEWQRRQHEFLHQHRRGESRWES